MAKKDKRATEHLNVALVGIESALSISLSLIGEDHQAYKTLSTAREYCEEARDALLTIQFHSVQI